MDIFVNINQNSKDLLDIIPVISVIITAWITFTIYIFNYTMKLYFGKLEIKSDTNDKLIPILVGVLFVFFAFGGGCYAYSLDRNSTIDSIAIYSLIIILIIALVIYSVKLNKSNKVLESRKVPNYKYKCKLVFIFIMNIIIGVFIGFDAIYIIKNGNDLRSTIFGIVLFIWIYYLILMTSGLIFCETILSTLKLYELKYNEENIQCYLMGAFNDFFKIKDRDNTIRLINKDAIKEIREIGTVGVENNEKFKGAKWRI